MQKVELSDSLGNPVEAILSIPPLVKAVAILSHGFTSSKNNRLYVELESSLNNAGIGTVRYDYFGHGPAYGHTQGYAVSDDVTLSKVVENLNAVVRYVKSEGDYSVGLLGSSFGGLVSLVVASQDPSIRCLVLKSTVAEPIRFWKKRLGSAQIKQWEKEGVVHTTQDIVEYDLKFEYWQDLQKYNTLEMARRISCPVLIFHGDNDTYVPISQSYDLAKVLHVEVNVVKGADHSYSGPGQNERIKAMMIDFLVEKLLP